MRAQLAAQVCAQQAYMARYKEAYAAVSGGRKPPSQEQLLAIAMQKQQQVRACLTSELV